MATDILQLEDSSLHLTVSSKAQVRARGGGLQEAAMRITLWAPQGVNTHSSQHSEENRKINSLEVLFTKEHVLASTPSPRCLRSRDTLTIKQSTLNE